MKLRAVRRTISWTLAMKCMLRPSQAGQTCMRHIMIWCSICSKQKFSTRNFKERENSTRRWHHINLHSTNLHTYEMDISIFQTWTDQKIVGNSLQPIGVIITGNLFIKVHVEKYNRYYWSVWLDHEAKNFPVFSDMNSSTGNVLCVINFFFNISARIIVQNLYTFK